MEPNYAALAASDGAGEPVRATVQAGRSIGSLTIDVDNTTNWPTGTFIATTGTLLSSGKLDPTTVQVFYGTASGTVITIDSFAAGYSDLGSSINDVVVIKPTTEWANIASEGILGNVQFPANFANFVEATAGIWSAGSGLVGSGTAGFVWYAGARSAMAAVVGHTFTASKDTYVDYNPSSAAWTYVAETNGALEPAVTASSVRVAKVVTGSSAITYITQAEYNVPVGVNQLPNWQPFTPVWTNLTPGSGTNVGYFVQIGKTVFVKTQFIFGSGSSISGTPGFTLPVTASSNALAAGITTSGNVAVWHNSGSAYFAGVPILQSTTSVNAYVLGVGGSLVGVTPISSTVPATWATSDQLTTYFSYEV